MRQRYFSTSHCVTCGIIFLPFCPLRFQIGADKTFSQSLPDQRILFHSRNGFSQPRGKSCYSQLFPGFTAHRIRFLFHRFRRHDAVLKPVKACRQAHGQGQIRVGGGIRGAQFLPGYAIPWRWEPRSENSCCGWTSFRIPEPHNRAPAVYRNSPGDW